MLKIKPQHYLEAHLNVAWLRPESALWDAIASTVISKYEILPPSLDLGCGNGIFSFITAGGNFSIDYDWYMNTKTEGFWDNKDIYDVCNINSLEHYIAEQPEYTFTYGLDHKSNLLQQAGLLNLYDNVIEHDANLHLPFEDNQLQTVFSNILYWLSSPQKALAEIYRILDRNGVALLCIPSPKFYEYCFSYGGHKQNSSLLKKLNRGRNESMHWVMKYDEFVQMAQKNNFKIIGHSGYLSELTLNIWDIGLRPLSPLLIKMANNLKPDNRKDIKREWIETLMEFFLPLYEMDQNNNDEKGFNLFILEK